MESREQENSADARTGRQKEKNAGDSVPPKMIPDGMGNSFPVPTLIIGRDMVIVQANRLAAESLAFDPTGGSLEEIEKRLASGNGAEAPFTRKLISDRVLKGHSVQNIYFHFRNGEGDLRLNLGSAGPINSGEKIIGAVAVWQDITDQLRPKALKEGEHKSNGSEDQEERGGLAGLRADIDHNRRLSSIGTLAATVAHELRNPLGVIRTAAYNLRRKNSDPSLEKHIDNIQKKINDSVLIINNLLNYSRIHRPARSRVRLSRVIAESIRSVKKQFPEKQVTIRKQLRKMRGRALYADQEQLREVFVNIIKNGYQAIEGEGRIEIIASIAEGKVIIDISDNGAGIDEEEIDQVFDPFFTGRARGTGLGLSVCRELIELHGGTVSIRSEKGSGTVVTVKLPLERKGHE
mgnify:CR=1 FL=1